MTTGEFLEWYVDAYSSGHVSADNYLSASSYLDGFIAGGGYEENVDLVRCASLLRGAYNVFIMMRLKK